MNAIRPIVFVLGHGWEHGVVFRFVNPLLPLNRGLPRVSIAPTTISQAMKQGETRRLEPHERTDNSIRPVFEFSVCCEIQVYLQASIGFEHT